MAEVTVNLGNDSYLIEIIPGSISQIGKSLNRMPFTRKALVVTDDTVGALYGKDVLDSLTGAGYTREIMYVRPGESSKSIKVMEEIYTKAIAMGLDRKSPIIALGGGVVGDLTGFAAATYLRGVPFIQVPTTLLAQVDSSVGGKTAVNHPLGKNMIGAFYQPKLVQIDPLVLNTLPERELLAGIAEVIKHGVIADEQMFNFLFENVERILAQDANVLTDVISRNCRIKAEVVEKDEREANLRMTLNFGHTVGHAIEAATGFSRYNHGEGVAIGMHAAALISQYVGQCETADVDRLKDLLQRFGLPIRAEGCSVEELEAFLSRDKKSDGGKISWILLNKIGHVQICNTVPANIVHQTLRAII
ncbi:MAG TPA: 3-dehydroquinate synthase [Methylomusa anaerophila]|uniref:3-dehydroquinate synthase n=1 Tax=Methylomusa anaerophila TaxID=1930071 RepID=A0A348AQG0_9FIRM|nr:3-dehydroquinate synthase [Methylomusa anaerophila]BBB93308.1 3-dehydroquinate synthase [Methylomusa anaerophila]HML86861.1 3-dehydroquinate synthase [Methylomusa anaerophila]